MPETVAGLISDRKPLAYPAAGAALARCVVRTVVLLLHRQVHLPTERVGMRLTFSDETSARVYRETVVDQDANHDPGALVVDLWLTCGLAREPSADVLRACRCPARLTRT